MYKSYSVIDNNIRVGFVHLLNEVSPKSHARTPAAGGSLSFDRAAADAPHAPPTGAPPTPEQPARPPHMSDSSWSALGAWTHDRLGQIGQIVTSPAATAWETASSAFGFGGGTPAAAAPSVPLGDDDAEQVPTLPHDCAAAARCRDAWLTARALCRAPPAAPSASARLLQTMMRHLLSQERNGQN